ncbi:MAG: hypothetical protein ACT4P3_18810 [Betaproteobacteria bacterium]
MQEQVTVSWKIKAGIGAIGAVALVLLKLIEANFYIDDVTSKVAIAAYCTYAAYIVLGMIVAVFLSDTDVPPRKTMRSAFVTGLLAPTMLIALMTQPPTLSKNSVDPLRRLQHIAGWLVQDATAQETRPQKEVGPAPGNIHAQVTVIRKQDLEPKFADAFMLALGRDRPINSYMYVIGFTEDYGKAAKAANTVNAASMKAFSPGLPAARVVRFEGSDRFFVTVGDAKTLGEVTQWKIKAQDAAVTAILKQPQGKSADAAKLLLDGQVIDGRQLFVHEKAGR